MNVSEEKLRLIFGIKIKQYRQERDFSLKELSARTGLSVSYLNEMEKGKKYPKADKIVALAKAFGIPYDELASSKLDSGSSPFLTVLNTDIIKNLPFDLFGINAGNFIDLISNDPGKFNAFIGTIIKIARYYDVRVEHFFFTALRSYQEMNHNYFGELEDKVSSFMRERNWDALPTSDLNPLYAVLRGELNYEINETILQGTPELAVLHSVFTQGKRSKLFINGKLLSSQKAFTLAKEIGFCYLKLQERPTTSTWLNVRSFEEVLNNFKASYFAGALLLNRHFILKEVEKFFARKSFDGAYLLSVSEYFHATPEMLFHRFTQILPTFLGLKQLFFLRIENTVGRDEFELTKELHFSRLHNPHSTRLNEHYCRRWVAITLLRELGTQGNGLKAIAGAQRSVYANSGAEYFVIAIANQHSLDSKTNTAVVLGFALTDEFEQKVRFWNDKAVPERIVNETCERCGVADCAERVAPPVLFENHTLMENRAITLQRLVAQTAI